MAQIRGLVCIDKNIKDEMTEMLITACVGGLSLQAPVTLIELSVTKSTIISTMNHLNIFISPGRC